MNNNAMNDAKEKEYGGMLNSSLDLMFQSMIRKQMVKQSVDPARHKAWVEWLTSSDQTQLLDMINANAIKHCWGTGAFIVVDDQPQNESTKCQVLAADGIDDIEKNLGEKPPFCDQLRKACPLKLIDRFPLVVVYGIPQTPSTWIIRCSIMMMPFVASSEAGAAQTEWVSYFENHDYADELPKFTVDELRSTLARSMHAAHALRSSANHDDPITQEEKDLTKGLKPTENKEIINWEGVELRELKAGSQLYRGSPLLNELQLSSGAHEKESVSGWFCEDPAVAAKEASTDNPPAGGENDLGKIATYETQRPKIATYETQRPLTLLTLTPDIFVKLKRLEGKRVTGRPTLEVALRVLRLLPTSSQVSELINMVVDRVPSVDPSLWSSVDAIFRAKLAEVLAIEQFRCQPPITFRDIQNEFAETQQFSGPHALPTCFTTEKQIDAKTTQPSVVLRRHMLPPIEKQVTLWLTQLSDDGGFPFDGLYVPPLLPTDSGPSAAAYPSQLALTANARLSLKLTTTTTSTTTNH
jgi:hypothetical protein